MLGRDLPTTGTEAYTTRVFSPYMKTPAFSEMKSCLVQQQLLRGFSQLLPQRFQLINALNVQKNTGRKSELVTQSF